MFGGGGATLTIQHCQRGGFDRKKRSLHPDACDMNAFQVVVRPARITADIRIEANTLSSQQLRSCFRVLLNASRVSAIASRVISQSRSEAVNGRIITADQNIKT